MFLSVAIFGIIATSISAQELVDIPTTAMDAGNFTTLVAALDAAGLVDTLSEPNGPFTVFAPNDDAFSALPPALVPCLLEPDNIDVLSAILTYHVVDGAILSTDLVNGDTPTTLNGETISIDLSNGVSINGDSTVITADIETSNGVIHIIDNVLVPPGVDVESFLQGCAPVVPDTTGETDEESGGAVETDEESGAAAPAISILAFVAWTLLIV